MDVTTTSPHTHAWELLAQLALCGQHASSQGDSPLLVQRLAPLLQQSLPQPWGVLVALEHGQVIAWESWGLSSEIAAELVRSNGSLETQQGLLYRLRAGDEVMGHLLLAPPGAGQDEPDQVFYEAVAAQLGLLLRTQRSEQAIAVYRPERAERGDALQLLGELSRVLASTTDLAELLHEVYERLTTFFPLDSCTIALYRADYNEVTFSLLVDNDARVLTTTPFAPEAGSAVAQIVQKRQPLLLAQAPVNVGPQETAVGIGTFAGLFQSATVGAWLGVPLLTPTHQVIGVITVESRTPEQYGLRDLELLRTVAAQVAISVQNAQLLLQAEDQVLQLGLLNHLSAVAAATQEMKTIYQAVMDAMVQVTGVDQSRLVLYERDLGIGRIVAEYISSDMPGSVTIPLRDNPVVDWLERHKTWYVSYDAQEDPLFVRSHATFHSLGIRSIALVPLMLTGEVVGTISLDYMGRQAHFSFQQLEFCQTIANHVATVIEKDRLFVQAQANAHALQVKVGELSTLLESAGILGSLLRPDEVLNSLMDLVSRQLRVTSVVLWTIRSNTTLMPIAIYGLAVPNPNDLRLPIGQGLTGRVAETGLPSVVDDVTELGGTYFPHFFGPDERMTAFMGVPVFYQDRVIGVLSVMSTERRRFTADEMMVLTGLAGQAAIALENARLFQERERRIAELTTINQISAAVNATFELDELLLVLHQGISEILDTSYSFIGLYDEARIEVAEPMMRLRVVRNGDGVQLSDEAVLIDGKGLLDYVVLKCAPLLLQSPEEIEQHVRMWHVRSDEWRMNTQQISVLHTPFACWLSVPIMMGDHMLGMINVQSRDAFAYDTHDLRFLSTVASQAAVAVSNARLFSERERRLRELSILKDIGSAISSTLDLPTVLANLRYELGQAVDVSTSMIGLYDDKTTFLSYTICYDQGTPVHINPSELADDANGWVIRNRQPLLLHTIDQARQIGVKDFGFSMFDVRSGQSHRRLPRSRIVQSFLVVPIISGDTVLGVINLQSYRAHAFDQDDLRFVMTVANQAAVTISNIYLFLERGRRIEELVTFNEISRALSTTVSVEELPELVYRQTSRLMDTSNFSVALVDEEHGNVSFPIFYDKGIRYAIPSAQERGSETIGEYRFPRPPSGIRHWSVIARLTYRVISMGEPLVIQGTDSVRGGWITDMSELREELGSMLTAGTPHWWMGVPLIAADKVLGIIALQNYERAHAYGPDDVRLLSTIASSAAIALENARLFEQISNLAADLERRVADRTGELAEANTQLLEEKERLETVHAITLELTASLDLDETICRALEMTSTNLGVARGSIMLRDVQTGDLICRALLQDQGMVQSVYLPISFTTGDGLAQWVIQHQEAVCIPDVRRDSRWVLEPGRADMARSVVAAPLMTSDTTLGVLILSSPKMDYFTDSHLRLLSTIANEVAIAINNAQLYGYITEMATRLADLLEHQKEETSKTRSVFQSMTEGVIVLDTEERIAVMNPAAEHMLGIPASAVLEQPLAYLAQQGATEEQQKRAVTVYEALEKGLKTAKEREGIYSTSFELFDPTQIIAVNLAPVTAFDGRIYGDVVVLRDITREIESDRAKRDFISNVSHELRTPLTAIRGYLDLLLLSARGSLDDQQISFLTVVKTNSNRLMDLINDILDISRFEAGKIHLNFAQVDMRVVIQEVVQSLRLEAEKKQHQVVVNIQDTVPLIWADQKRLTQVVTNLFSNAIKYTFDKGRIEVRVFLNPANLLQIEVEDTGVGMSPTQLKKLFRPFYRADNPLREQVGGTGLGLLIAKSLVEHHGGEMWVTSEPGKGTVFSFVLPLEQQGGRGDNE